FQVLHNVVLSDSLHSYPIRTPDISGAASSSGCRESPWPGWKLRRYSGKGHRLQLNIDEDKAYRHSDFRPPINNRDWHWAGRHTFALHGARHVEYSFRQ